MFLFDFIIKCFYALLVLIKKTWHTFVKVFRAGRVENSNIFAKCCENSNQSNIARTGVLNEDDAHVSLLAKSAQLTFNSPEVIVSSNVRAECSQHKNQSNPFEELLSNNGEYVNLPARSVQFIRGTSEGNGVCVNLPAQSVQFICSSPEVNASYNVRAECTQNMNQSNSFEAGLLINNGACVNSPVRSAQLFNNLQAVNASLTRNNFGAVSGQSKKTTPADFAKTDGDLTNFESRTSSIGTSQIDAIGEVEMMPVSGRKRFKSARLFYKKITNAASGSSSNHGHEDIPLILTHRKRKFCGPLKKLIKM